MPNLPEIFAARQVLAVTQDIAEYCAALGVLRAAGLKPIEQNYRAAGMVETARLQSEDGLLVWAAAKRNQEAGK